MAKRENADNCCKPANIASRYKVEAVISIDERGQMILPKDLRDKAGIRPGEKRPFHTLNPLSYNLPTSAAVT